MNSTVPFLQRFNNGFNHVIVEPQSPRTGFRRQPAKEVVLSNLRYKAEKGWAGDGIFYKYFTGSKHNSHHRIEHLNIDVVVECQSSNCHGLNFV